MAYRVTDMETVDVYEALSSADTLVKGVMQSDTEVRTVLSWGDLAAIKLLVSKEMERKRRIAKETDRRMRIAERLAEYLDDAYMSHLGEVRIVHGKGTGKLRETVQRELKKIKYVKSFRSGEYGEGDAGVTIVKLKQ